MRRTYRGTSVEVGFDLDRCIHAAECLRALPDVFDLDRRPWILPDASNADAVAEAVRRCPSGALQYHRLDGGPDEEHARTTVRPIRNGPLQVEGEIRVAGPDGTEEVLPRAMLCRCGNSARKPFCDNSHLRTRFEAPGEPLRVHLSRVRPDAHHPITAAEDPRRHS